MAKAKKKAKTKASGVKRSSLPLRISELMNDYVYRIDLDADYQREKVWTTKQQEELLDSIIKGIDIPKLYLAEVSRRKNFDYECIDGKQRLLAISAFVKPVADSAPLKIEFLNQKYSYVDLKKEHASVAKIVDDYVLDFVIYDEESLTEPFVREIFRRLQLGVRLNSGEILNSQLGAVRDFVFKEIGSSGPFVRNTSLSDKRYSKQFTLAQICINSFHRAEHGEFCRARLTDLEEFFADHSTLSLKDDHFVRIRKVLQEMDARFGNSADAISSRAVAVSAFLFCETLCENGRANRMRDFAEYFVALLSEIEGDMKLVSQFKPPRNPYALENFQKYVLQASVEPYSIRRRQEFLEREFWK